MSSKSDNIRSSEENNAKEQIRNSDHARFSKSQTPQFLFLISLPILSVIGTLFVRFHSNTILLVMVFLLSLVPILVAFNKISLDKFDLAIVAVSLALLYCVTLSTDSLWGADIHEEYYFANLVKTNYTWDSTIPNSINAVLSIVMLAPISSLVLDMPLLWIFKILYPLLFSFVPLTLYRVFKKQTSEKIAFLSVFLFVSVFTFYTEMIGLARQQIAEVFLALLTLVIVDGIALADSKKRNPLLYVFGASLVFSHYAVAYIFIGAAAFVMVLCYFKKVRSAIGASFFAFCLVLSIGWYTFVAGGVTFDRFVSLISNIIASISKDFLNPQAVQPLHLLITSQTSLLFEVTRVLNILVILLITVGLLAVVLGRSKGFKTVYIYFSAANFILFTFSAVAPFLAASLNTTRLYHITLIVLAPFCLVGAVYVLRSVSGAFKSILKTSYISRESSLKAMSIFLCVFLLFNTGFVYEMTNSGSSIMNLKWGIDHGTARDRLSLYNSYTPADEIAGAEWLSKYRETTMSVFADYRARNNALNAYSSLSRNEGSLILEETEIYGKSYVYLRAFNMFDNLIEGPRKATGVAILFNSTEVISQLTEKADLIYSSRGSEIYYVPTGVLLNMTS